MSWISLGECDDALLQRGEMARGFRAVCVGAGSESCHVGTLEAMTGNWTGRETGRLGMVFLVSWRRDGVRNWIRALHFMCIIALRYQEQLGGAKGGREVIGTEVGVQCTCICCSTTQVYEVSARRKDACTTLQVPKGCRMSERHERWLDAIGDCRSCHS